LFVIDSSALIAFVRDEKGADIVENHVQNGFLMSVVNYAETKGKLVGSGTHRPNQVDAALEAFGGLLELVNLDREQAEGVAFFYARRNPYGLSLGDCACLALAETKKVEVLTAEQSWKKIPNLKVKIRLIR
jgi:ribonuclease VapC